MPTIRVGRTPVCENALFSLSPAVGLDICELSICLKLRLELLERGRIPGGGGVLFVIGVREANSAGVEMVVGFDDEGTTSEGCWSNCRWASSTGEIGGDCELLSCIAISSITSSSELLGSSLISSSSDSREAELSEAEETGNS